jgi:hypothetical protein
VADPAAAVFAAGQEASLPEDVVGLPRPGPAIVVRAAAVLAAAVLAAAVLAAAVLAAAVLAAAVLAAAVLAVVLAVVRAAAVPAAVVLAAVLLAAWAGDMARSMTTPETAASAARVPGRPLRRPSVAVALFMLLFNVSGNCTDQEQAQRGGRVKGSAAKEWRDRNGTVLLGAKHRPDVWNRKLHRRVETVRIPRAVGCHW